MSSLYDIYAVLVLGLISVYSPDAFSAIPFSRAHIDDFSISGGQTYSAAWGDYNRDGRPDLFLADFPNASPTIYKNTGTGFVRINDFSVALGRSSRAGVVWADADNDGDLDIFVATTRRERDEFIINHGGVSFAVSDTTAIVASAGAGHSVIATDFNNDGYADFFVANGGGYGSEENYLFYGRPSLELVRTPSGDLGADIAPSSGAAAADFDGDGRLDLFVADISGRNSLFRNTPRDGWKRDAENAIDSRLPGFGNTSAATGDIDNDGDIDIILSDGSPFSTYLNDGKGRFTWFAALDGRIIDSTAAGLVCADFNNDGWLDVLVSPRLNSPQLYEGVGGGRLRLTDTDAMSGIAWGGNGIAVADYDLDGDLDVFLTSWDPARPPALFKNQSAEHSFLRVHLTGTTSQRDGLGARVSVTSVIDGRQVTQIREIGGFDSQGSLDTVAHFGLGNSRGVDRITIAWPSGIRQELGNVTANQPISVVEPTPPAIAIHPLESRFTNRVDISLSTRLPNVELRFTTDGSEPSLQATLFSSPFEITAATTIRARAFFNGFPVTEVVTASYQRVYVHGVDGISADWRTRFFGADFDTNPNATAFADPDGDGADNRQEYTAQTDPLDRASGFRIGIRAIPEIRFPSIAGRTYRVLRLKSLVGAETETLQEIRATGDLTTFIDDSPGAATHPSFYQIVPLPQ